jgi:hypothetical protein
MAKPKRVDIVPDGKGWAATLGGKKVARSATKSVVVGLVTKEARKGKESLTVRIHKRDGSVQEEHTWPRPPRRKGATKKKAKK